MLFACPANAYIIKFYATMAVIVDRKAYPIRLVPIVDQEVTQISKLP